MTTAMTKKGEISGQPKTRLEAQSCTRLEGQPRTRLETARWAAGYPGPDGLVRFAKRMRRVPAYVRRIELHGQAPLVYALVAQRILQCHMNLFMWPDWQPDGLTKPDPARPESTKAAPNLTQDSGAGAPQKPFINSNPVNMRRQLALEAATPAARQA